MKGTASYLMKFLDGSQKRFTIPVYQRNYDCIVLKKVYQKR